MSDIDNLKKQIKTEKTPPRIDWSKGLSTGSTILNLACTGRAGVGLLTGKYYFMVGDSAAGKSFISLTCLAEAGINPNFKDYRFIYDNAEDGALMNLKKFFGKAVEDRLEPPAGTREEPCYSTKVEEFYYHVDDAIDKGKPFIYILDSMDSLSSDDEEKKFDEHKKAHHKKQDDEEDKKTGKVAGSYGTSKAKLNSSYIRLINNGLSKTNSILIVISQTRDNIGWMAYGKTRGGGHALRFYATLEMWLSVKEKIDKTVNGRKRNLGIVSHIQFKKNRITGRETSVDLPIYFSSGVDDTGSCIDYLVEEKHWTETKGSITAKEFNFKGNREALVELIESTNKEKELKSLVAEVWSDIEDKCKISRKRRYD